MHSSAYMCGGEELKTQTAGRIIITICRVLRIHLFIWLPTICRDILPRMQPGGGHAGDNREGEKLLLGDTLSRRGATASRRGKTPHARVGVGQWENRRWTTLYSNRPRAKPQAVSSKARSGPRPTQRKKKSLQRRHPQSSRCQRPSSAHLNSPPSLLR